MPIFKVVKRVDAYVVYETKIEAETAQEAADSAYDDGPDIVWTEADVIEFDARHVVALDDNGEDIEETRWGKG